MTFFRWSTNAASNATADSSCPWPEGMAPSQVNDSARGQMAALAKFRNDISGLLVTGGTATAYTVSSNQGFGSLANLNGAMISFVPHVDSGAAPTLRVDGLDAKPIRGFTGNNLISGTLVAGTPYVVFYNNTKGEFILHSYFASPAEIPIGSGIDYWGAAVPNENFAFPYGQAISRTSYPICFARLGTMYGSGDGSTTFNLPDKRGRFSGALDNLGGSSAGRLAFDIAGTSLGAVGGNDRTWLGVGNLPQHFHSGRTGGVTRNATHTHGVNAGALIGKSQLQFSQHDTPALTSAEYLQIAPANTDHEHDFDTNGGNGLDNTPFGNLPPTIVCNYIIRIR